MNAEWVGVEPVTFDRKQILCCVHDNLSASYGASKTHVLDSRGLEKMTFSEE